MSAACVVYAKLLGQFNVGLMPSNTVTVKLQLLDRPVLSVAIQMTDVLPRRNVAGLIVDAAGVQIRRDIPLPAVA